MAISELWYLCPFDIVSAPGNEKGRACAMRRHIASTNAGQLRPFWAEVEARGNKALVIVIAEDTIHTVIQADTDFSMIEFPIRAALRGQLIALGYPAQAINKATDFDGLCDIIASERNVVITTPTGVVTVRAEIKISAQKAAVLRRKR